MSERDGKMYLVSRLLQSIDLTNGASADVQKEHGCAGVCFVYWTKTAARKQWGNDVPLIQLELRE